MDTNRCAATYPGAATLAGRAIRCEMFAGHAGQHAHSFAARYWRDAVVPAGRHPATEAASARMRGEVGTRPLRSQADAERDARWTR